MSRNQHIGWPCDREGWPRASVGGAAESTSCLILLLNFINSSRVSTSSLHHEIPGNYPCRTGLRYNYCELRMGTRCACAPDRRSSGMPRMCCGGQGEGGPES
jgi:hypothetical protein